MCPVEDENEHNLEWIDIVWEKVADETKFNISLSIAPTNYYKMPISDTG